jgi:hypothetical protein
MMTLTDRLGNDIAGYLQEETPAVAMNQQQLPQQTDGFFGFLNMSPRSQSKTEMSVEEFHRQNQQFLQSSEQERARIQKAMRDSSPQRPYVLNIDMLWSPGLSDHSHTCIPFFMLQTNASIAAIASAWPFFNRR